MKVRIWRSVKFYLYKKLRGEKRKERGKKERKEERSELNIANINNYLNLVLIHFMLEFFHNF